MSLCIFRRNENSTIGLTLKTDAGERSREGEGEAASRRSEPTPKLP